MTPTPAQSRPTLSEVLHSLGYTHAPTAHPRSHRRMVSREGSPVWEGTAGECWAWLRASGQYLAPPPTLHNAAHL